jgi:Flp pilus assembly protein TadD
LVKNNTDSGNVFDRHRDVLIAALLVGATLAVYWQVRHFDFVRFDDTRYITENRHVKSGLTAKGLRWSFTFKAREGGQYWQPLTYLSHMLDVQIFGLNPGRHHLANLFFHVLNSLILFRVLRRMSGAVWRSAFVGALFALHPLNVESVAWIAERKNVLSTFFWLLTMWAYVRYVEKPVLSRYLMIFLVFILGLMAKPMLVTLPFILLLLDYWPLGRFQFGLSSVSDTPVISGVPTAFVIRLVGEKVPFLVISAVAIMLTSKIAETTEQVSIGLRVANALVTYVKYIIKMIWPRNLAALYPYPERIPGWQTIGALLILVCVTILILRQIKVRPYLGIGWLWYLGALVPVTGVVQSGMWPEMADRWGYVPLIGLFIMMTWGVHGLSGQLRLKKKWLSMATTVLFAVLMTATFFQVRYWENSYALFKHIVEATSNNAIAHNNLGYSLASQRRLAEAITHYQEALRIKPDYEKARNNLGDVQAKMGRFDEAIKHHQEALRINPHYVGAHNSLGIALARQGRTDEAIRHFQEALRLQPDLYATHNSLGKALAIKGRLDEAIRHFQEALRLQPNSAESHNYLGIALVRKGNIERAIIHFKLALRLKPGYVDAKRNLSKALMLRR